MCGGTLMPRILAAGRVASWAGRTRMETGGAGSPRARWWSSAPWWWCSRWWRAMPGRRGRLRPVREPRHGCAPRRRFESLIAEKITDEVVLDNEPDLVAARPLIESVASGIVGGRAFTEPVQEGRARRPPLRCSSRTRTPSRLRSPTWARCWLLRSDGAADLAEQLGASGARRVIDATLAAGTKLATSPSASGSSRCSLVLALALVAGALWLSPIAARPSIELGLGLAVAGRVVVGYAITRSVAVGPCTGRSTGGRARGLERVPRRPPHRGWILRAPARCGGGGRRRVRPLPSGQPLRRAAAGWAGSRSHRVARGAGRRVRGGGRDVLLARDAVLRSL